MSVQQFIFTNDDVGGSDDPKHIEWFERVVEWLDKQGIPGTFFWIPNAGDRPGYEKTEWMQSINRAREKGHDFQLHGYRHDNCLEFGLPAKSTRIANPKPFEEYDNNKEKWQAEHAVEKLGAKLKEGAEIYERAFGKKPLVFRSPCGSTCKALYGGLKQAGILYSTSCCVNPIATAYTFTKRPELRKWAPDFPSKPFQEEGVVVEMPLMEDLAFFGVSAEDYDDRLDLYKSELSNYIRELDDWKFGIFTSHYHCMMKTWDQTRRLYEELFDWLRSQGVVSWTTFKEGL